MENIKLVVLVFFTSHVIKTIQWIKSRTWDMIEWYINNLAKNQGSAFFIHVYGDAMFVRIAGQGCRGLVK